MRGYNIESGLGNTFNKLDNTVNQMAGKIGDGMGLGKQVEQRPWLMIGAALAAGYVVGTFIGGSDDDDYERDRRERSKRARSNTYASRYNEVSAYGPGPGNTNYTSPTTTGDKQSMPASSAPSGGTTYNYEGSSYQTEFSAPKASSMPSTPSASSMPSTSSVSSTPSTSHTSNTPPKSEQSGISSMISEQLDTATATAVSTVRNLLRDTIRDAVPSMRDQVDELDRRDGRTPPSSASSTSAAARDVDSAV